MTNKPTKPIKLASQTKEEQEMQIARFFANKREQFSINILCQMAQGCGYLHKNEDDKNDYFSLVDLSVEMADRLIQKLYPVTKEEKK